MIVIWKVREISQICYWYHFIINLFINNDIYICIQNEYTKYMGSNTTIVPRLVFPQPAIAVVAISGGVNTWC